MQIAGGSGLTPMLQVIQGIVGNPEDKTQVTFVFANKTEEDIILRKELDELAKKHDNVKVFSDSAHACVGSHLGVLRRACCHLIKHLAVVICTSELQICLAQYEQLMSCIMSGSAHATNQAVSGC